MILQPRDLFVSPEASSKFYAAFGTYYDEALRSGHVVNAAEACKTLEISEAALGTLWEASKPVKFGGGFYCGKIGELYVINGFYMAMRAMYVADGARLVWFSVEWPENTLSWADFRAKVVGATNPAQAEASSIRRALLGDWERLGLAAAPTIKENGLHASASPLEALAERRNWLHRPLAADDPFGAELLEAGATEADIDHWVGDPPLAPGSDGGSLFDFLEDTGSAECIERLLAQR